jgi:YHS domain-containing protein
VEGEKGRIVKLIVASAWYLDWLSKEVSEMTKDPVCGMAVDPETAAAKIEHKGQTYYFCCSGCKAAFEKDPEKYLEVVTSSKARHHGH